MLGWLTVFMLLFTQTMSTAQARSFSGTSTINASNLEDGEKVTLKGYENTKLTINIDVDKTIESIQPETTDAGHIIFEGDDSYTLTISDGIKEDPLAYVYGTKIEMKGGSLVVNNQLYAGDINISGGSITATGNTEAMHTGDFTISGGSVSATATGSDSVGISVWRADLDGGSVTAGGGQAAIKPRGESDNTYTIIDLGENMGIISPAGGRVSDDQKSIITAGGTVATAVKLGAVTKYPVWVSGTQVTSANKDDILGDGGKARFDPSTNTLTLNNPTISGMHEQAMIYALGIDLMVEGKATLNYPEAATAFNARDDGINGGCLTLNGDFSISGSGLMSAVWADYRITVKGGSLTCTGGGWGLNTDGYITIEAGTVEISSGFTGIKANDGITISGGTVNATGSEAGTGNGAGIDAIAGYVKISNAAVTAKGRVYGIAASGDITIAGNSVTAETWVANESQALRADGNLTISGGTVTTKTAATGIRSLGNIKIENGTEKVETDAKKHAVSADATLVIGDGLMIKEPAGGIIQGGYIYEAGGTTEAIHALIVPKEVTYPVWVGGTQVTESNRNDILGDGKARFDPSTNTLTLSGITASDGLHASGASIVSTGIDLSVKGSATLSGSGYGIYVIGSSEGGGNLTLDGATITYAVASGSESGIRADGNISISNSTIDVTAAKSGIQASGSISINGGTVTSEAAGKGICASHGNITISGGTVKATSSAGANAGIEALNGKVEIKNGINNVTADGAGTAIGAGNIAIGDGLMIKEPEGGTVGDIPGAYVIKNPDDSIATHALIVPKEASVPSWTVTFDANGHGTAPAAQTVTDGGTAVKPADPTETGWTFGGWYTDAACTAAFDFSTPVTGNLKLFAKWTEGSVTPPVTATYSVVSITNSAWTRGSGASVVITVKRSEADDTCFSHFTGVQIDSAALASGDYEAKAGSTVVTLKATTLQKLSAGNHTAAIHFDDGKAEANLTISDAADTVVPEVPKTGDDSPIGLWIALMVLSVAGLWALTGFGRKRRTAGRR